MTTFFWLTLIYGCAVFFWLRYLYNHSLRKPEDRLYLFETIKKIAWFIPMGVQAICLFCFALVQVIPLSIKLGDLIELLFFTKGQIVPPDFESLKIIFIGSLLLALQYLLIKKNFSSYKALNWLVKLSIFISSIFFLRWLTSNIFHSLSFFPAAELSISYNNNYVWFLCFAGVVIFTIVKGEWIYDRQIYPVKYLSLASRILMGYLSLVFIISVPRIIFTIIQNMR